MIAFYRIPSFQLVVLVQLNQQLQKMDVSVTKNGKMQPAKT